MRKLTDNEEMANLMVKRPTHASAGFSLIEVMVVVAIVGIMATIAVPNIQQLSRKSMQNEAKNTLAQLFSLEKMFRADQGFYTMCLAQAGYSVNGNNRKYLTGTYGGGSSCFSNTPSCWSYDQAGDACSGANIVDASGAYHNDSTFYPSDYSAAYMGHLLPYTTTNWGVIDQTSYTLGAQGWLGGAVADVWQIDQDQNLSNTQSGL